MSVRWGLYNRIFAAAIFQIQTASVGDNIRLLSGSDIFIQAFDWKQPLDEVWSTPF
jgi:hypothetical protein